MRSGASASSRLALRTLGGIAACDALTTPTSHTIFSCSAGSRSIAMIAEATARCDEALALGRRTAFKPIRHRGLHLLEAGSLTNTISPRPVRIRPGAGRARKLGPRGFRVAIDELVLGRILLGSGAAERRGSSSALVIAARVRSPNALKVGGAETLLAGRDRNRAAQGGCRLRRPGGRRGGRGSASARHRQWGPLRAGAVAHSPPAELRA